MSRHKGQKPAWRDEEQIIQFSLAHQVPHPTMRGRKQTLAHTLHACLSNTRRGSATVLTKPVYQQLGRFNTLVQSKVLKPVWLKLASSILKEVTPADDILRMTKPHSPWRDV